VQSWFKFPNEISFGTHGNSLSQHCKSPRLKISRLFFWEDSPVPKTMQDIELELLLLCLRRRSLLYWCIVLSVLVVVVVIGVLLRRKISYRNWQSSFPYIKTRSFFLVYLEVTLQSIKSHREDETHSECRHSILWNALHCFFPLIPSGCLLDTHWLSWDKTMKNRKSCQFFCSVTALEGGVLKVRATWELPTLWALPYTWSNFFLLTWSMCELCRVETQGEGIIKIRSLGWGNNGWIQSCILGTSPTHQLYPSEGTRQRISWTQT
jgi:hypothetical protein